jgi:predicted MFS family arabinose efflux permease
VFWPVAISTALSLLGDTAMYTVLPTHNAQAGVTVASIGILLSANRWVRFVSNGGVGWLAERWPRRWLYVPALFIGVLATFMYAFTRGFWPLLVARLLWGIAWSGIWVIGNAIILDAAAEHQRGRWVGFYHTSFFMGGVIGAPLGGILTDRLGYGSAMGILAVLMLVGAMCALLFLPETRPQLTPSPTHHHPRPTHPPNPPNRPPHGGRC